jgi:hypothetical protein
VITIAAATVNAFDACMHFVLNPIKPKRWQENRTDTKNIS